MKIYNVFDESGGTHRYLASCTTRKLAEKRIAEICKQYPDIYKKSYLKIRVGNLIEEE